MTTSPPLRIGNCSGFYGDRFAAMREMLDGGPLDVLTGDYLAELTMLILGRDLMRDPGLGHAKTFVRQMEECLGTALEANVRIVANAGGLNPHGCAAAVQEVARGLGLSPRIAVVDGDDLAARADEFGWPGVLTANAYLGAFGIARAYDEGADVIVTGRVTDASLVVGPAAAHFGWQRADHDALAGAMAAGHVIECGMQATGGNFSFFTEVPDLLHAGFPIAEVEADGSSVITKHPGTGGMVDVETVTSQLLYEIQDERYAGPDAVLRLDSVQLRQEGPDRVRLSGVRGEAPPPDLKVSCTRLGGYRQELTFHLTGLDIEAKADLVRQQVESATTKRPAEMTWTLDRTDHVDPTSQAAAAARLTLVARDADEPTVGRAFVGSVVEFALGTFPGCFLEAPPGKGTPYGVYEPAFVAQAAVDHGVTIDGRRHSVPAPTVTRELRALDAAAPSHSATMEGPTRRAPLGLVMGARSGDKGGSANIGVWVRSDEAAPWLDSLLTTERLRELLPELADLPVTRTRLPHLRAVNFVVDDILGQGVAYGARFDPQAKALGEWLRARVVDIPAALLPDHERSVR